MNRVPYQKEDFSPPFVGSSLAFTHKHVLSIVCIQNAQKVFKKCVNK